MSLGKKLRNSQLWRSIFRHPAPLDRRNRVAVMLTNFVLHLHSVSAKKNSLRFSYTWGMGLITLYLFLVEVITGVLLMFYYRPTIECAYNDILALRDVVSFGVVREVHRWAAHAMVITVMLHMFRVFLTGSYKAPREFNWVIGVLLLVLTFLLSFTGYLLPMDQLSMWAITVGSNMARATPLVGHEGPGHQLLTLGGVDMITSRSDARLMLLGARTVGQEALNRFYVLHCVALPLVATFLVGLHLWRVRKDGGISGPVAVGDGRQTGAVGGEAS
ncbi:MAG TPA: DUF4405 domain-containing protein [Planctomycetaceae bacterium]|nr:DUF4405 domain-containing protein [Planctomycetaceae bacterium]HIQ22540.1 DUF4405 domain-containing protein [Planctomycetota bacterium]